MTPKYKVGQTVKITNGLARHGMVTVIEEIVPRYKHPLEFSYKLKGVDSTYGFNDNEFKLWSKLDKALE